MLPVSEIKALGQRTDSLSEPELLVESSKGPGCGLEEIGFRVWGLEEMRVSRAAAKPHSHATVCR